MNVSNKVSAWLLEMIGQTLWGLRPNLMKDIVQQHGAMTSLSWFAKNMPRYEKILKEWGAIRTHLLASEISVLNSCAYCTYGHVYALQLHYFKENRLLMPVDENEIVSWHSLSEDDIIKKFHALIEDANLMSERPILDRMLLLRQGSGESVGGEDDQILHLIKMFSFLNSCGVNGNTVPDEAHDPINKDTELRQTYHRLRDVQEQAVV